MPVLLRSTLEIYWSSANDAVLEVQTLVEEKNPLGWSRSHEGRNGREKANGQEAYHGIREMRGE